MTAQTVTQRVAAMRARRASEGLTEVRGIFLPQEMHKELKVKAEKMLKTAKLPNKENRNG